MVEHNPTPDAQAELERGVVRCSSRNGWIVCEEGPIRPTGRPKRLRLHVTRRDIKQTGPIVLGYDICAISSRNGFHCFNTRTKQRVAATQAKPLKRRTWFSWDQGLCAESDRFDETSLFECFYREAGIRQKVDFRVSQSHRTVSFESGGCVCSEPQWFYGKSGETPVGAACFFRDDEIPRYTDYNNRVADSLTRGVIMRGPIFTTDFGDVCDQLENTSAERAVQLIEAWASGETALPPHTEVELGRW